MRYTVPVYGDDAPRPNILWLVAEDICNNLGCFGDPNIVTPNIDRLASQGLRYPNCWSNAPVCAPARTSLLTGMFPPSLGAQHMRSMAPIPAEFKPYPLLLKEQGYFTTNNAKTDYNVDVNLKEIWNECGNQAHWKHRAPGQPFFAVFNHEISHESQIRNKNTLEVSRRHDPAKILLPAYHPDAPEVRKDWAQYYDRITQLDDQIQARLDELDKAGLTEDTIVFFYGDNGGGMPRGKRTVLATGQEVPLIIRIPEKFKHLAPKEYMPGGVSDRLVSFVDFAPTILSLVGAKTPENMQGKAFAGPYDTGKQPYIYGFRGRMDERYDSSRSIRDDRYVLALNLYPNLPYGHHNDYMFQTPTTAVWKKLYDEGKLPPQQAFFFELKPVVEMYDLKTDKDQVHNIADQPKYKEIRDRLLTALLKQMCDIRDIGFLSEAMFWERTKDSTPYEMGHDPKRYDFNTIANSWLRNVGSLPFAFGKDGLTSTTETADYKKDMSSSDDAVRYWVATSLLYRLTKTAGLDGYKPTAETTKLLEALRPDLEKLAGDEQRIVRIPVAEALGRYGTDADVKKAESILLEMIADKTAHSYYRSLQAFNSLDYFAKRITDPEFAKNVNKAKTASEAISAPPPRAAESFSKILKSILP